MDTAFDGPASRAGLFVSAWRDRRKRIVQIGQALASGQ